MSLPNIYIDSVLNQVLARINRLNEQSQPQWGKMNASQMLAHLNVMFELGLEEKHRRPNAIMRFMLQAFVKNKIISEVPYKKNSMTAPEMVIKHQPGFLTERKRVMGYLELIGTKGANYFEQREHPSFGRLSASEWSNLLYKHIDHHLTQFGV